MNFKNHIELFGIFVFVLFFVFAGYAQSDKTVQSNIQYAQRYQSEGNYNTAANYFHKVGTYYSQIDGSESNAIKYYKEGLECSRKTGNNNAIKQFCNDIGFVYARHKNFDNAIKSYQTYLEVARKDNDKAAISDALKKIATTYTEMKKYNEAITNLKEALQYANELNNLKLIRSCYSDIASNYSELGDTENQTKYFQLFASFNDKIKQDEIEKERAQKLWEQKKKIEKEYQLKIKNIELEKKEASLKVSEQENREKQMRIEFVERENALKDEALKEKNARIQKEKEFRTLLIGIIVLVLISLLFFMKLNGDKKKANKKLKASYEILENQKQEIQEKNDELFSTNEQLAEQKQEIEDKNTQIMSSIHYAKKIQEAILPSKRAIQKNIPDSFIFYRPKDVVSGDFYWFTRHENKLFIAAVDCTGHSVPGAFMSMIGHTLLNEIVNEKKIHKPAEVLAKLNSGIIASLKQEDEGTEAQDGMDISLCSIDIDKKEIQLASAVHSTYIFHNGNMQTIEGDIFSIGGGFLSPRKNVEFTNHVIPIEKEATIYMFSDGFQDQFGGPYNKKFMVKGLENLIENNKHLPMNKQLGYIEEAFVDWKGQGKQTDDVLLLGLRVKV